MRKLRSVAVGVGVGEVVAVGEGEIELNAVGEVAAPGGAAHETTKRTAATSNARAITCRVS
jgi:hypothetical protein